MISLAWTEQRRHELFSLFDASNENLVYELYFELRARVSFGHCPIKRTSSDSRRLSMNFYFIHEDFTFATRNQGNGKVCPVPL